MGTAAARGGDQYIPRPTSHALGRPAPWSALDPAERTVDLTRLRRILDRRGAGRPAPQEGRGLRQSAVLAPLYEHDGEAWVVLTKRSRHLRNHKGEISFPGGRIDPHETPFDAALREADEEIALDPATVEVIGELDHLVTIASHSAIVPLVAVLPGRPAGLVPHVHEVERILHVPLAELVADGVYREERWGAPPLDRGVYFFELVGETVWGATARMLVQLLSVALGVPEP